MKTQEQLQKDIDIKILLASARFFQENGDWYFEPYMQEPVGPFPSKLGALMGYENMRMFREIKG